MAYVFTSNGRYPFWPGRFFLGRDKSGQHVGIALERHALTVAGSGGGKGVGLISQNARRWTQSLLCLDPKEGENLKLSWAAREALGQQVRAIDPYGFAKGVPDRLRSTFNPLAEIDPASLTAATEIRTLADGLVVVHDPRHMEWVEGARDILAGLIAYNVQTAPPEYRTLADVRRMLVQGDGLYADAESMMATAGLSGLAAAAGDIILQARAGSKMEGQFLGLAKRSTKWLDDDAIRQCLGSSSFSLRELKASPTSVFVVLHPDYLDTHAAFLRLFVQAALNAMTRGGEAGTECLFILDEFYTLGKVERVQKAAGKLRSYGVHLWPILQNLGQLDQLYGVEGREIFLSSSDAVTFFNCGGDDRSLDYISRRIGALTPEEITSGPPAPEPFDPVPQPKPIPFKAPPPPAARAAALTITPIQKIGWFSTELSDDDRMRDTNAVRLHGDVVAANEAKLRAENENAMREWQAANTAAETAHRAAEEGRMREWHNINDRERQKHEAAQAEKRAKWEFGMRQAFQPRLTPYEVERLIAKREGEKVARSMIVFSLGGDILNVPLYPSFQEDIDAVEQPTVEAEGRAKAFEAIEQFMQENDRDPRLPKNRLKAKRYVAAFPNQYLDWNLIALTDNADSYDRKNPIDKARLDVLRTWAQENRVFYSDGRISREVADRFYFIQAWYGYLAKFYEKEAQSVPLIGHFRDNGEDLEFWAETNGKPIKAKALSLITFAEIERRRSDGAYLGPPKS